MSVCFVGLSLVLIGATFAHEGASMVETFARISSTESKIGGYNHADLERVMQLVRNAKVITTNENSPMEDNALEPVAGQGRNLFVVSQKGRELS